MRFDTDVANITSDLMLTVQYNVFFFKLKFKSKFVIFLVNMCIKGVTGGMDQTSEGCSLC